MSEPPAFSFGPQSTIFDDFTFEDFNFDTFDDIQPTLSPPPSADATYVLPLSQLGFVGLPAPFVDTSAPADDESGILASYSYETYEAPSQDTSPAHYHRPAASPPKDGLHCALCGGDPSPSNPISVGKRRELMSKWGACRSVFGRIQCAPDATRHWTCRQQYRALYSAFADKIIAETSAHCYPLSIVDSIFEEPFPPAHKRCLSGLSLLLRVLSSTTETYDSFCFWLV